MGGKWRSVVKLLLVMFVIVVCYFLVPQEASLSSGSSNSFLSGLSPSSDRLHPSRSVQEELQQQQQKQQEQRQKQRQPTPWQIFQERNRQVNEACQARRTSLSSSSSSPSPSSLVSSTSSSSSSSSLSSSMASSHRRAYPVNMMWAQSLSFCGLPKTGTTFWKRVLYYVDKGLTGPLLSHDYGDIHRKTKYMLNSHRFSENKTYKNIVFVREPYSRLFSAYVDKVFKPRVSTWHRYAKPAMLHSRPHASNHDKRCFHNVTFEEFVRYFIHTEMDNDSTVKRDKHFVPVSRQCHFCELHYDFIGRQETFAEDTLGILTQLNFSAMLKFSDLGHTSNLYEMVALINYTFQHEFNQISKQLQCMSKEEVLRRLWKSLQICGTLGSQEFFPLAKDDIRRITKERFLNMALSAYNRSVMDNSHNRKESLLEAYSMIPYDERVLLKTIFHDDFKFFGYNPDLPLVFPPDDEFQLPYYRYLDIEDSFLFNNPE